MLSVRNCSGILLIVVLLSMALAAQTAEKIAVVTVTNPLSISRPSETIVLDGVKLHSLFGTDDLRKLHVQDKVTGKELITQPVDVNDDGKYEEFLFQTDLAANETRQFTLKLGKRQELKPEDFKAYGRFVQERRDDFAWENDRIAHRMYGPALETWPQEPLTSSAIDVWTKKTRRLVVNEWYMVDNYHKDHGEGADMYSAGNTRGCGGSGIFSTGKLYPSANFRHSRTLANGPIRVMFELEYPAWEANGVRVTETKRITLDAGQNMDRYEAIYKFDGDTSQLQFAAGIRKTDKMEQRFDAAKGILRTWEPLDEGNLGCAVVFVSAPPTSSAVDNRSHLAIAPVSADGKFTYYAGFGWDQSGDFKDMNDWDAYVNAYAERLRAPVKVSITAR